MTTLGKIEAILNDQLVVFSSSERLITNEIVSVYAIIEVHPKLKEKGLTKPILYPKGQLRVICPQEENKYLGERFREVKKRTRKEIVPSPIAQNLASLFEQLRTETKEITEEIPGEWSAELNKSQSLNITTSNVVSVGDLIGREG